VSAVEALAEDVGPSVQPFWCAEGTLP
jgi:hypothetical protein